MYFRTIFANCVPDKKVRKNQQFKIVIRKQKSALSIISDKFIYISSIIQTLPREGWDNLFDKQASERFPSQASFLSPDAAPLGQPS
jgi:hypothetical protein